MYNVLVFLNLITLVLLVGGLCFANQALVPIFITLTTDQYAEVHYIVDKHSDPYMPILTFATALLALSTIWFPQPAWQIVSRVVGAICIASVAAISIHVHGPINRHIRTWKPGVTIEHLSEMRMRWTVGHRVRTWIALIGLLALLLPVVFPA